MKRIPSGMLAASVGMSAALAVLLLYAASLVQSMIIGAILLFLASVMTWIPLREDRGCLFAVIEFVLTCAIALLIARGSVFTYIFIFGTGYYAILRFLLRTHIDDRTVTVLIRLLFFNALAAGALAVMQYLLKYDLSVILPNLSVVLLIVILELTICAFMFLYRVLAMLFDALIRDTLFRRR